MNTPGKMRVEGATIFSQTLPEIWRQLVEKYLDVALIITSVALIASVIMHSKGAGLGGFAGGDTGGVYTARRGIEKTLFRVTIVLGVLFFILAIATVLVAKFGAA